MAGRVVGQTTGDAIAFLLAFVVGALSWGVGMGSLLAFARRRATPRLFRAVDVVCGVVFGYFAIRLLAESIGVLRGG